MEQSSHFFWPSSSGSSFFLGLVLSPKRPRRFRSDGGESASPSAAAASATPSGLETQHRRREGGQQPSENAFCKPVFSPAPSSPQGPAKPVTTERVAAAASVHHLHTVLHLSLTYLCSSAFALLATFSAGTYPLGWYLALRPLRINVKLVNCQRFHRTRPALLVRLSRLRGCSRLLLLDLPRL